MLRTVNSTQDNRSKCTFVHTDTYLPTKHKDALRWYYHTITAISQMMPTLNILLNCVTLTGRVVAVVDIPNDDDFT